MVIFLAQNRTIDILTGLNKKVRASDFYKEVSALLSSTASQSAQTRETHSIWIQKRLVLVIGFYLLSLEIVRGLILTAL